MNRTIQTEPHEDPTLDQPTGLPMRLLSALGAAIINIGLVVAGFLVVAAAVLYLMDRDDYRDNSGTGGETVVVYVDCGPPAAGPVNMRAPRPAPQPLPAPAVVPAKGGPSPVGTVDEDGCA